MLNKYKEIPFLTHVESKGKGLSKINEMQH
jgi:hypothetical protein